MITAKYVVLRDTSFIVRQQQSLLSFFSLDVSVSFTFKNNQTSIMEGDSLEFCVGVVSGIESILPNGFVELRVDVDSGIAEGIYIIQSCSFFCSSTCDDY